MTLPMNQMIRSNVNAVKYSIDQIKVLMQRTANQRNSVWEVMSDEESMRCKACNKVISIIAVGMHEMSTLHKRAVKGKEENDD